MTKKLTYGYVKEYIEKEGYKLLSKTYKNAHTKILVECPRGHKYKVVFYSFKRKNRCPICHEIKVKYTYKYIKEYIEKEGYKLLSKEYKNSYTKLLIECPKGHIYKTKFTIFQQGHRCLACFHKNKKFTYEYVKDIIEKRGYKLLSKKYINIKTKLLVECPEKHQYEVSFNNFSRGTQCPICIKSGKNNPSWKGGVKKKNLPLYDTYASQIDFCEEVRRDPKNKKLLQVRCTNSSCRKWFTPKASSVINRICLLKQIGYGGRFYCSDECKYSCSIYRKRRYPEGFVSKDLNREVQPELRQLVFERDDYTCVKCGSEEDIQCHHIIPVKLDPIESADIDNCITLCKQCHKKVHQQLGCTYSELGRLKC